METMIQVIDRALNILEAIASSPKEELGLSEIVQLTDLNPATCANILKTLVNRNYVEQLGKKKGYKLGHMIYKLTQYHSYNIELKEIAVPLIEAMQKKVNETIILSVIEGSKRILLYQSLCQHEIQVQTAAECSAYKATTGRLLLSHYSLAEQKRFIALYGLPHEVDWPNIDNEEQLLEELEELKNEQLVRTINANQVVGLATPIWVGSNVIARLGVFLPSFRFIGETKGLLEKELIYTTKQINQCLNGKLEIQ